MFLVMIASHCLQIGIIKNENCQFEALNLEYLNYKKNKKFNKVKSIILKQEKLLQKLSCNTHFQNILLANDSLLRHSFQ